MIARGGNLLKKDRTSVRVLAMAVIDRYCKVAGGLLMGCCLAMWMACGSSEKDEADQEPAGVDVFQEVVGIDFYEVRRAFDTGVSYDSIGFVQLPEWHLRFAKKDSILVYSPFEDRMIGYKVHHDHAMYFHFARDSWRVVELHSDSLVLQRLSLNGLTVNKAKSNVYMKFYSADYLEHHVGDPAQSISEKVAELRKPTPQDTAFVKQQIARANKHLNEIDSAFASRNYAVLKSKHPALKIEKRKVENFDLTERSPAYEYLYPEYTITIDPAYRNFHHDFSVNIDPDGQMHLGKVYVMEEFLESRERVVEGVIDVYLHNWLEITPAHTLGMPHSSTVWLYVKGRSAD